MSKMVYPVIFTRTDTCILIEVPDLQIVTEGMNFSDAIDMARDAIGAKGITMEDMEQMIPTASQPEDIRLEDSVFLGEGKSFISMIDVDFVEYRRKNDNRTVRRNVTLPNWLNREAEAAHINVSRVLQDALKSKLNLIP